MLGWWDQDLDLLELNANGNDLLYIGSSMNRRSICEDLIRRGFNMNRNVDDHPLAPLGPAIRDGHMEIIRLLLESGADPNLDTKDHTLLCLAVETGPEYV